MKRVLGVFVLLFGIAVGGWLIYNLVAGVQPEARGRNPIPAILFTVGAIYVGVKWMRGG
jgi:hypothetical protein